MKRAIYRFLVTAALCLVVTAQGADVMVLNGDVSLTISSAVPGQAPDDATNETGQLEWTTLSADPVKKITVQSGLSGPQYTLKVQALNVTSGDGAAAGEVSLSTIPADLVVDIPADVPMLDPGTCTLRYTASAAAVDGAGSDSHTITFTIVDQ